MMNFLPSIVLKIASRCNLNCSYCYVYNHIDKSYLQQPKFISEESIKKLCQDLIFVAEEQKLEKKINITLHGGEPLITPLKKLRNLLENITLYLKNFEITFTLQTNGVLISKHHIDLIKEFNIFVSISLDGTEKNHDKFRVDHRGKGSFSKVKEGIKLLQREGINPYILSVICPYESGRDAYRSITNLGISRFNFLIPDVTHDSKNLFYPALKQDSLFSFLKDAFDEWIKDDKVVQITLFNDVISGILGGSGYTDTFGSSGNGYFIVESDGSYEILDVFKVCYEEATKLNKTNLMDFLQEISDETKGVLNWQKTLSEDCLRCRNKEVCNGGYLPHRYSKVNGFKNPSAWCDDIFKFIDYVRLTICTNLGVNIESLA